MRIFLLVDESGSMAAYRTSTVDAIKSYIAETGDKDKTDIFFFNSSFSCRRVFHKVQNTENLTGRLGYNPGGSTPLYDSILFVLDKVKESDKKKRMFAVITDGLENASEHRLGEVQAALEEARKDEILLAYIGSNQNAEVIGARIGFGKTNSMTYRQGEEALMAKELGISTSYADTVSYTEASTRGIFTEKQRSTWRPEDHPRGSDGRFISTS